MKNLYLDRRIFVFVYLFFTILLFITNQPTVIANEEENKPVLIIEKVTGDSVHLAWPLTICDVDCNILHLTNFQRWEIYQKSESGIDYQLVFNTSTLSETKTIITNLESNAGYYYFVKIVWDTTNWEDYYQDYKENFKSQTIFIETLNPGETQIFSANSLNTTTTIESSTPNTSPGMMLYYIPFVFLLILFIRRRK
ncbi:MAG: hypothetical protein ACW99F_07805 [Candidatus Hodarchaeales archaeon]|jgi:hypothetical protein